jgi:hypothetical protein
MALVANSKVLPINFGQLDPHALPPWSRVSHDSHETIRRKINDAIAVGDFAPFQKSAPSARGQADFDTGCAA